MAPSRGNGDPEGQSRATWVWNPQGLLLSPFSSCPVCRYCQTPEPVEENKCFECGVQEVSESGSMSVQKSAVLLLQDLGVSSFLPWTSVVLLLLLCRTFGYVSSVGTLDVGVT